MRIENWCVIHLGDVYDPPELQRQALAGYVYGHPNFEDGHSIRTSYVVGKVGDLVKTKSGSEYELGAVLSSYEEAYPGAKDRLMSSLPAV